jgi:hypothetical protein
VLEVVVLNLATHQVLVLLVALQLKQLQSLLEQTYLLLLEQVLQAELLDHLALVHIALRPVEFLDQTITEATMAALEVVET